MQQLHRVTCCVEAALTGFGGLQAHSHLRHQHVGLGHRMQVPMSADAASCGTLHTFVHSSDFIFLLRPPQVHKNLSKTYTTAEDVLLWRNQCSVVTLRVHGSALLGGFLVEPHLLPQLHTAMPALQRVEIVKAKGLVEEQLRRLVRARVCRQVLVQGCGSSISDRVCAEMEADVGGVAVEYSL